MANPANETGSRATRRSLERLWRGFVDLVLPATCCGCRCLIDSHRAWCERCDRSLQRIPSGLCVLCQQADSVEPTGRCAACAFGTSSLCACIAGVAFAGEVENWVHRFKYPSRGLAGLDPAPFTALRALLVETSKRMPGPRPQLIVPVPLHPKRLRERGFNPAAVLARSLARACAVPCDPVALHRIRVTASQTGLDRRARARNVRGAFRARRRWRAPANIWIVDDVVTTGSTLTEAARALRRAGAENVSAICSARTL